MSIDGLYVHVPFCARACPYCDFDFQVRRTPDVAAYRAALRRELALRLDGDERPVPRTLYLGGGTPSILSPGELRALHADLRARVDLRAIEEHTVELNPEHVDADRLAALVDAGVDRVSIGLQSTAPRGLVQLGRAHRPDAGLLAIESAARLGLRTSADLIVGWPGQRTDEVIADVAAIARAGATHASVYALTIEPETPWPRLVARGQRAMPDPDRQAALLTAAGAELCTRGFSHYEVSSYAMPGQESRHNSIYWTFGDVLGLGPSAASVRHLADGSLHRRTNPRGVAAWTADPQAAEHERLGPSHAAAEGLWLGLRRLAGLHLPTFFARFPATDEAWLERRIRRSVARGNLERPTGAPDLLRIAPERWLFHDEVGADVLAPDRSGDAPGRGRG